MRRTIQRNPILIISFLLMLPIIVHGFFTEEEKEHGLHKMSLELVHRNDPRLAGIIAKLNQKHGNNNINNFNVSDRLDETIKGFIQRDSLRRARLNYRWGLIRKQSHNRRRDLETTSFQMPMHSGRDYGVGEYFVQVEAGTPSQKFWLAADSGSEFTWFNCRNRPHRRRRTNSHGGAHRHRTRSRRHRRRPSSNPCDGVFCPQRSTSFQTVTCSSHKCKVELSDLFSLSFCPKPSDPCLYDFRYVDGSSAKGFFGTDTITVDLTNGKKGKLENLTIGCTKSMLDGSVFNEDTGGLLGLGYAKDSFVDKAALEYGGKFSYCLVDHLSHQNVSSYLTFGTIPNSVTLLSKLKSTELVVIPPFYGVNVIGISMGGQMLKIPNEVWDFNAQGGTILDSGTTLTSLALLAYEPVFEALNKSLAKVKRVPQDFGALDFCFDFEGFDESAVPRLVFHFAGGARFEPPLKSYIIDAAPQVKCIGIVATNGPGASVIGNIMQQNHLWEFDLPHNTVGFAPSTCS